METLYIIGFSLTFVRCLIFITIMFKSLKSLLEFYVLNNIGNKKFEKSITIHKIIVINSAITIFSDFFNSSKTYLDKPFEENLMIIFSIS